MKVVVLGSGIIGTTTAYYLAKNGHDVVLWAFEAEVAEQIAGAHENPRFLPDVRLPETLRATSDLAAALADAQVLVNVVPSQFVRRVMTEAAPHVPAGCQIVNASKGIETATLERMDEVLRDALGERRMEGFTVLSGPSFAREVAREAPTLVVAASDDLASSASWNSCRLAAGTCGLLAGGPSGPGHADFV